jgi:WXG100 family type VII secretion target
MAKVGGDVAEMREMAKMYTRNAQQLAEIIRDLNTNTGNSERIWTGPAAERFRTAWNDARPQFDTMRTALDEAGTAVNKNAQNIEDATR